MSMSWKSGLRLAPCGAAYKFTWEMLSSLRDGGHYHRRSADTFQTRDRANVAFMVEVE